MSGIVEIAALGSLFAGGAGAAGAAGGMGSLMGMLGTVGQIGMGVSAASSILGGLASSQTSDAEARAYQANAEYAMGAARNQAAASREQYRRLASSQRAAFGASGVDVNEGSALDVLALTDAEAELSAMELLYGGEMEAWSWKQKAATAKNQGGAGMLGGLLGAVPQLLQLGGSLGLLGGSGGGLGHVFDGNRTGGVGGGWLTTALGSR
ncbi:hypothetical protein [Nitratidesulfovibrio termitidis]|uniref:hypothetical protein n=1 Tax=Nitratidesulfovibrio termitidis TaxID=42252 RepID=UPI0004273A48|nr:hypothetical protein [Nitratidesulfovibrio termitidis]